MENTKVGNLNEEKPTAAQLKAAETRQQDLISASASQILAPYPNYNSSGSSN